MNKKEWKAHYGKWRAVNSSQYSKGRYDAVVKLTGEEAPLVLKVLVRREDYGDYRDSTHPHRCFFNMKMSKEACERKRLKDRGERNG
jgi:hypothetical protein